jgi:excisionase family DNA binding protein
MNGTLNTDAPASASILTREQVAALLDCEPHTVDVAARRGDLPGVKYGRSWVFPRVALLEFLNHRALAMLPVHGTKAPPAVPVVQHNPLLSRKRVID